MHRASRPAFILFAIICFVRKAVADEVQMIGAGSIASCGTWLSDRQTVAYYGMSNWALGFLSGAAAYSGKLDPLNGLDANAVTYWLDNYCQAHPTERFARALTVFVREHPK